MSQYVQAITFLNNVITIVCVFKTKQLVRVARYTLSLIVNIVQIELSITYNSILHQSSSSTLPRTQSMRMRLAFGVIVRLFLPIINGMAKGWQGVRSIKVLRLPRTYHANRSLFTNLFAHAANTLSMSLSSVHGTSFIVQLPSSLPLHQRTT